MKQTKSSLPLAAGLGALGLVLGRLLYSLATDSKGLLVRNHPLSLLLWLLIPVSLAVTIPAACKSGPKISAKRDAGPWSPLGQCLTAGTIAVCVLTADIASLGGPGRLWQILGLLSVAGLLLAALGRLLGKKPSFVSDMILCLFLLSHLVSRYRQWCADPQIMDYLFELLGVGLWMLFSYYRACFRVGLDKPRMYLATGLLTVTFCLSALGTRSNLLLCLGGVLFTATSLICARPEKEAP